MRPTNLSDLAHRIHRRLDDGSRLTLRELESAFVDDHVSRDDVARAIAELIDAGRLCTEDGKRWSTPTTGYQYLLRQRSHD